MAKNRRKKNAPKSRATPQSQQLEIPEIIAGSCRATSSDVVNVAMAPDGVVLTFYQTVPDPRVLQDKKTVLYANAIVKIPLSIGLQLPTLIIQQALENPSLQVEDIGSVIEQIDKIRQSFVRRQEEMSSEPDAN